MNPPELLPATPEEAEAIRREGMRLAYRAYRKHTRPYRRAFRGIRTRRESERFIVARIKKQTRVIQEAKGE